MNPAGDRPDVDPALAEAAPGAAGAIAAEQFAHGLLETLHRDSPEGRERRIAAMLSRLEGHQERPRRLIPWRAASGLAAAVLALATLVLLALPTQTSAEAIVQRSVAAAKTAGDRRYEVRVMPPRATELEADPIATLDIRDADHVLIRARSPFGDRVVVGRNESGAWAIRPDGSVDRYPPRRAWPRWVDLGQSTIMLESVDELLASLGESYTLKRLDPSPIPSATAPTLDRVSAARAGNTEPGPRRIELWIDRDSHVVRRMEVYFDPPPPGPRAGQDRRPPPDRPRGPRPPPPPPPPRGERHHPPPEFLGEAPDFRGGRHPPPPKLLVFELADDPAFADGWFEPETHAEH